MKYFCTNCSYSYDEAIGDEVEGVESGTRIEFFKYCPQCSEEDTFISVKEEVNYIDENTHDLRELEHDIEVELLGDDVHIIIAENEHPMESEHKIVSVSLIDEYGDLVEERFLSEDISALKQIFKGYSLDDFEVHIKCNKHGVFGKKITEKNSLQK